MFDERRFNAAVALKGETQEDAARVMGISLPTLYRKKSGVSDFYREEMEKFCEHYNVGPADVFFVQNSA